MGFDRNRSGGRRSFGGGGRQSFGGGGGRRSFGGGRDRNRDSGDREMFSAVCDNCGKDCQVPFRPTSGKPVLCSDCFGKSDRSNHSDRGSRGGNSGGGDSRKVLEKIASLEAKLDKVLDLLGQDTPETKEVKPKAKKTTKAAKEEVVPAEKPAVVEATPEADVESPEVSEVPVEMPEAEE